MQAHFTSQQNPNFDELGKLLSSPFVPEEMPVDLLYHAACIGAVTLLQEEGGVEILANSAMNAAAEDTRIRALQSLISLAETGSHPAIHKLFEMAIKDAFSPVCEYLREHDLNHEDSAWNSAKYFVLRNKMMLRHIDPELELLTAFFMQGTEVVRVRFIDIAQSFLPHWKLTVAFLDSSDEERRKALLVAYPGFSDDEKLLLRKAILQYSSDCQYLLADILLECEDSAICELCAERNILPRDSSQNALFFFLSEQWARYYESDVDFRLIRQAYELDQGSLRARLINISRRSGNTSWLQHIDTVPGLGRSNNDLSLSEWQLLIDSLFEQKNFERLFEVLPGLPFYCMRRTIELLEQAAFTPADSDSQSFLTHLAEQIGRSPQNIPVPLIHRFFSGNTHAIGLALGGDRLAAAFLNGDIHIWNTEDSKQPPLIIQTNGMSLRQLCMDAKGRYLSANCGDASVRIFETESGRMIKQIRPGSDPLVSSFIRADSRRLLTVDNKGHCSVWAFPNGTLITTFELGLRECFRCSYDPDLDRVTGLGLDGGVCVFDVNRQTKITSLSIPRGTVTTAALSSHDLLSGIDGNNKLFCKNLISERDLYADIDSGFTERISQLFELKAGELAVLGTVNGSSSVIHCSDGVCLSEIRQKDGKSAVTGIQYDSNSNRLYICSADGSITAWDLTIFFWMVKAFSLQELPGLSRIDELCKKYPGQPLRASVDWMKTVIQWRRRFDIEVELDYD